MQHFQLDIRVKQATIAFAAMIALVAGAFQATFADTVGYVDMEKVQDNYSKAQDFMADLKVRQAELRKMEAEFVKQLEEKRKTSAKNPIGQDKLEKDLQDQFQAKQNEYQDWATARQKELLGSVRNAIKMVAQSKNIDVVLAKQAVFEGGSDITNEVLMKLNTSGTAASAVPATKAPSATK
ncbi:MAG: OmpH family outer membrane protein [Candidatus Melainabacteria bacterium]|nr:OmpH family outer membrane protein [Candidatus Melainabacteria bacterium]